ncbi:hypothetical protein FACS189472_13280 [Alphaproteobacteria bacterium]|nr:hypothetical protein FACS189472_13280 [Alphaproteobacteria bacterium]
MYCCCDCCEALDDGAGGYDCTSDCKYCKSWYYEQRIRELEEIKKEEIRLATLKEEVKRNGFLV